MKNVESDNIDITNDIKKPYEQGGWKFIGKRKRRTGIYKILNLKNGKYYVGSSNNITNRLRYYHYKDLTMNKHFNKHLQRAWNKYGEKCFRFYIVKGMSLSVTDKELLREEQKHLDSMSENRQRYYNQTFIAGKVEFTPAMRKKMSVRQKKWLKENGHPRLGTHPSKETLKRLSRSHLGIKLSEAAKRKISGRKSVAHRPDVKAKKRQWWDKLRQDSSAYAEFCKNRAIKMAEQRYGNYSYAKNYENTHN